MFVKTSTWFYIRRFLLGSFEAGLFPSVVLYLTYWFRARSRALMLSLFATSGPISVIVRGTISGWIMGSMGAAGPDAPTGSGSSSWRAFRPSPWACWHSASLSTSQARHTVSYLAFERANRLHRSDFKPIRERCTHIADKHLTLLLFRGLICS